MYARDTSNPEDWAIFENTQEPIIEESVFWTVQSIRQGRRRHTKSGELSIFSGLLFCADCGIKMYRQPNAKSNFRYFYCCGRYHSEYKNQDHHFKWQCQQLKPKGET